MGNRHPWNLMLVERLTLSRLLWIKFRMFQARSLCLKSTPFIKHNLNYTVKKSTVQCTESIYCLDQQRKTLSKKNQFLTIEQSKYIKLNIDTKIQLTLYKLYISQKDHINFKNILNYCYKNVSFALLNGWNVTKTLVLTTHEREWRNPVSGLSVHLR